MGPKRRPRRLLPCSPARKSLPSGVCPGQAPTPASAEGLGKLWGQRAVQAAGPPRELDEAPAVSQPQGWPRKVPRLGYLGILAPTPNLPWEMAQRHRASRPWARAQGHLPCARPTPSCFSDLLAIKQLGETDTDRISTLTFQRRKPRHRVAFGLACKPHSQARGHCGRAGCSPLPAPRPPPGVQTCRESRERVAQGLGAVPSPPLGGAFCSCWA